MEEIDYVKITSEILKRFKRFYGSASEVEKHDFVRIIDCTTSHSEDELYERLIDKLILWLTGLVSEENKQKIVKIHQILLIHPLPSQSPQLESEVVLKK